MKCYDKKNKGEFIERYGTLDDYLYILYGDKHFQIEHYSCEKEKEILEQMKKQIIKYKDNQNVKESLKCVIAHAISGIICTYSFLGIPTNKELFYLGTSALGLFIFINLSLIPKYIIDICDVNKNVWFLSNEETYRKFNKYNIQHLEKVSGKAKKKIIESQKSNPIDINFINDISRRDLEIIRKNINGKQMTLKGGK